MPETTLEQKASTHELEKIAQSIKALSIDAVEKANSGHPGLPLGCAEIGAALFGSLMNYNPKDPDWIARDRFVLSAGHGSMLLYSCLHLFGYDLSLDDIKHFRQLHSKTPGHPESRDTEGVETTTGPLGQGFANACGMALGLKMLEETFNTEKETLLKPKVYVLMGDGCVMEGITSEASSLAGHLCLDNLIAIYDANQVSLDGPLSQSCSEDTLARYKAYGFETYEINGNELLEILETIETIKKRQTKPVLILAKTIIGRGAPNKQGTYKVHGAPLGEAELLLTKEALGIPKEPPFFISDEAKQASKKRQEELLERYKEWEKTFQRWKENNPKLYEKFLAMKQFTLPKDLEKTLRELPNKPEIAGRSASNKVLQTLSKELPFLIGGSADLSGSDKTWLEDFPQIEKGSFKGRNIKFGVREFSMASMATGLAQTRMFLPFVGTFLTFSDYMRNAIRLASLMKERVLYQFTHDSIFLGEDGPTHQPVEHLAALRAIPNLSVVRPADENEVKMAWLLALTYKGPTALILSRQNLKTLNETAVSFEQGLSKGAYILTEDQGFEMIIIATGSEVSLALDVVKKLREKGKKVRLVSMPATLIFDRQSKEYKESILPKTCKKRVSIEAATSFGWQRYTGLDGINISVDTFGYSAKMEDLAKEFGFTVEAIVDKIV